MALCLHFHSPDIRVGDHLFVKEQTANRTWWEETRRKVDANSVDESGDVVFGGGMQGSDMDVREWCGGEIFQHVFILTSNRCTT